MDPDGDASKQKSRRVVKQELPPTQAKAREWCGLGVSVSSTCEAHVCCYLWLKPLRFLLGSRAYRVHDYTTAVRHFSKAILLHNSQATFFAARAKAYRELADFKVCFRSCTRARVCVCAAHGFACLCAHVCGDMCAGIVDS